MTSQQKQWENSDLCKTKEMIHHLKVDDEGFTKMYSLLNWVTESKVIIGHLSESLAYFVLDLRKSH